MLDDLALLILAKSLWQISLRIIIDTESKQKDLLSLWAHKIKLRIVNVTYLSAKQNLDYFMIAQSS